MPLGNTALITQCPDCLTAFRATPEQLALREGRVRCGHCGMVFDARANLLDPDTLEPLQPAAPSTSFPAAPPPAEVPAEFAGAESSPGEVTAGTGDPGPDEGFSARPDLDEKSPAAGATSPTDAEGNSRELTQEIIDHDVAAPPTAHATAEDSPSAMPAESHAPAEDALSPAGNTEAFAPVEDTNAGQSVDSSAARETHEDARSTFEATVRTMEGAAAPAAPAPVATGLPHATTEVLFDSPRRTNAASRLSPWVSWPALVMLLLVLTGQVAFRYRGDLVLLFPGTRPWAELACSPFNCDIPMPRRVELMSIESSDLQADSTNPGVMVLSATLRNRAPFAQVPPALELTLTDTQDQPVARRVLTAADYFARSGPALASGNALFPAGAELPVKVFFEAAALKATGYRLYLFYP
jgi:predicted Zn finger-like uncharacterized protein